jgi:hypothetical protein
VQRRLDHIKNPFVRCAFDNTASAPEHCPDLHAVLDKFAIYHSAMRTAVIALSKLTGLNFTFLISSNLKMLSSVA